MSSWSEIVQEIQSLGNDAQAINSYINEKVDSSLAEISKLR